ncbi:UDP-N-acetylmuramoyl-tripeptide--D-alanyl-D-alanine ligase [Caldalkalibacillus uzonensis]|uniref:UDP-N-acetylmuramoyl-tripeptide--D-alanyl-D-alanine ligase n=1 Tax=Caldalkalibacillus uzonensis TaxID=353224 RepID=A0ABU0CSB5_9BACI|nr:UDP-N-acetylmuramoyl-tripeptide--D-alanyl-D-alanine ligase [Caldalkalibacillus uzonensis]MDQ0338988.1 UDP-N-acetylmuramoyl-tripeptide--D-alanyl-D-alanine ligase [Caldalkalibacillus uzonensis]
MLTVKDVVELSGSQLLQGDPEAMVEFVHFDSRQLEDHSLFVALTGGARDGHQFIDDAIEKGAASVLVSQDDPQLRQTHQGVSFIFNEDTRSAFQALATGYRKRLSLPVVAVTGSNGKTTTKDMIAHLLSAKFKVYKTYKNFNNDLGVPLSLLHIKKHHELAVLELGMNKAGEIDFLARMAQPNISVITNVGDAHIQFFGLREKIAEAKGELLPHTDPDGFVILNGDDPLVLSQAPRYPGKVYTYSIRKEADIYATNITFSEHGSFFDLHVDGQSVSCFMPMFGEHNISNLLPAAFIAYRSGINLETLQQTMMSISISDMRFQTMAGPNGSILINDAYNASPTSMKVAIDTFEHIYPGRKKVVVLGDIFELGEQSDKLHTEVGQYIKDKRLTVITVGDKSSLISKAAGGTHVSTHEEAIEVLKPYLTPEHVILLKASRGMKLEKIIESLTP